MLGTRKCLFAERNGAKKSTMIKKRIKANRCYKDNLTRSLNPMKKMATKIQRAFDVKTYILFPVTNGFAVFFEASKR